MEIRIKVPVGVKLVVDWEQSGLDDGPMLSPVEAADRDELLDWRSAAKKCQFDSPEELACAANLTAGQFIDGALNRKWQLATACESPVHAEAFRSAWCTETDSTFPIAAGNKIRTLRAQRDGLDRELSVWQKATGYDTPEQAKARLDAYQSIEKTHAERMDAVLNEWKGATESKSPVTARDLIHNLRSTIRWTDRQYTELDSLKQDIRAWQKATGATDPANAINLSISRNDAQRSFFAAESEVERLKALAGIELAAWQEMTGAKDPNAAYQRFYEIVVARDKACDDVRERDLKIKTQGDAIDEMRRNILTLGNLETGEIVYAIGHSKLRALQSSLDEYIAKLAERDQDLLTAHAEIDRLRKAAQTLGVEIVSDTVSDHEHAKVKAELQTKCREAQTWKEQAERVEKASVARGALLEKIGEALQFNEPIRWDPIPGQVAALKKSELAEKARADAEFKRRVDAETYLHQVDNAQFEFTNVRPGYAKLAEELKTSWKQATDRCASLGDAFRKEKERADVAEGMFRIEQKKFDDEKRQNIEQAGELQRRGELLVKTCEALDVDKWDNLPGAAEGVMEVLGRKTENAYASAEDLSVAQKDITDILTSQLRDVGIASAAGAVAGYFGHLVNTESHLVEVRKLLGAKIGEGVVDAAKRVTGTELHDTKVALNSIRDAITKKSARSLGDLACQSWTDVAARIVGLIDSAIFPLPKPENIEPGQKWAFVMTATNSPYSSNVTDFCDTSGFGFKAYPGDLLSAFYLGT